MNVNSVTISIDRIGTQYCYMTTVNGASVDSDTGFESASAAIGAAVAEFIAKYGLKEFNGLIKSQEDYLQ